MAYFLSSWIVLAIGAIIHILVDRVPNRRTKHRVVELLLLWLLVTTGVFGLVGATSHVSGISGEVAQQIGYAPSMFQWEVGWGDFALCVLLIACAWQRFRGTWMTAAVVVLTIQYGGDAIGHIMEYVAHDNTAPSNVWAIPSDILQPLIAIILLVIYRAGAKNETGPTLAPASA
ncbi:MAG: hypothetical protein Q7L55_02355 [Actinomycetota bacterium]|nr:hypothetical protein [Actinomycetota bacterium]